MVFESEKGMIKVKVEGDRRLKGELKRLQKKLGLKGGEWADFGARTVRDGVVRNAQPFGTGKKAREQGENAVRRDLLRCFRVVRDRLAGGRRVIDGTTEAREWHQRRRNARGRVRRGERRRITSSAFRAYLEEVMAKVGMTKGSVAGGGESRLRLRTQGWIKRWVKAGDASRRRKPAGAVWTFKAEPEAAGSDRVLGVRGVKRVMKKKDRLVLNAMRRDFRRVLKKQGDRVNRRG